MAKLRQIQDDSITHRETEYIEAIISCVLREYQINRAQLMEQRKGIPADARKMCYVVINEKLNLSEAQIGLQFSRHNKVVYRALSEYRQMQPDNRVDKKFFEKKRKIEIHLTNHFKKNP